MAIRGAVRELQSYHGSWPCQQKLPFTSLWGWRMGPASGFTQRCRSSSGQAKTWTSKLRCFGCCSSRLQGCFWSKFWWFWAYFGSSNLWETKVRSPHFFCIQFWWFFVRLSFPKRLKFRWPVHIPSNMCNRDFWLTLWLFWRFLVFAKQLTQ